MIFIGIDPGMTGALAWVTDGGHLHQMIDTPILTVVKNKGTRHELDRVSMAAIIRQIKISNPPGEIRAAIERVNSMPGQGVASSFTFGMGYGIWLGLLTALEIPVDLVHPVRWKKAMLDGMGKDKDASRIRVRELFPTADVSLKKHHGRADALLIAEYRRRIG